jgi:hypothetical protein
MTDPVEIIATLERNQQERRAERAASSREIKALLESASTHLEAARVNGSGNGNGSAAAGSGEGEPEPTYDDIRRSLDKVRSIVSDLKEGRY